MRSLEDSICDQPNPEYSPTRRVVIDKLLGDTQERHGGTLSPPSVVLVAIDPVLTGRFWQPGGKVSRHPGVAHDG